MICISAGFAFNLNPVPFLHSRARRLMSGHHSLKKATCFQKDLLVNFSKRKNAVIPERCQASFGPLSREMRGSPEMIIQSPSFASLEIHVTSSVFAGNCSVRCWMVSSSSRPRSPTRIISTSQMETQLSKKNFKLRVVFQTPPPS